MSANGHPYRELLAALDVCRPGSSDLTDDAVLADAAARVAGDPHAAELRDRIERMDRRLGEALDEVPTPPGLAERLLAELEKSQPASEPIRPEPAGRVHRRWVLAGGLAAAAAMVLAAAVMFWPTPKPPMASEQAMEIATNLLVERPHDAPPGEPLETAPADLPPSSQVLVGPQARWREVDGAYPARTVAYDLPMPGASRATLFVTKTLVKDIPYTPPLSPTRDTRGVCASIWRSGELTYILVVEGSHGDYRSLLRGAGSVLTMK